MKKALFFTLVLMGNLSIAQEYTAQYQVTFTANWSSITHPIDFPSGAHFSRLIGNSHNQDGAIWKSGTICSAGMEQMSETGGTTLLSGEINNLIASGLAEDLLLGFGAGAQDTYSFEITLTESHPLVSLVTMIAPSPDWFLGINGLNLIDNNLWVDEIVVDLLPYDTGTDSGITFRSANSHTNPTKLVEQITIDPFPNNIPLATLNFKLLSSSGVRSNLIFADGFEHL